jgi:hypothetical protein
MNERDTWSRRTETNAQARARLASIVEIAADILWHVRSTASRWRRQDESQSPRPMPIVVGVSRSGTTLLRLMLDAHPEIAVPYETQFLGDVLQLRSPGDALRAQFYDTVLGAITWDDFHLDAEAFRRELDTLEPFTLTRGLRCFYTMYARRFGKRRYGDKTPGYCLYMVGIAQLLPEAHFIHMIRDGRDVALSLRHLWFGPGPDLAAQAREWVSWIRAAREQAKSCERYLEVRYEDLLADPERVLRRVCAFVDLRYTPSMLRYHERAAERMSEVGEWRRDGVLWAPREQLAAIHHFTSHRPDQSRAGRWRHEMSPEERASFEAIAGDMLEHCGYETATSGARKRSGPEAIDR